MNADQNEAAEEGDREERGAEQEWQPKLRGVDARDLDLACGEFDQHAKVAVTDGSHETERREVNREFCFFENVRDREVVRDRAAPTLAHIEFCERLATNCGRAAPAKVFSSVTAEC